MFGDLNALHPFRDGNGRGEREFLRQLALTANKLLDFSNIRKQEILAASIDSFHGDYKSTINLFGKAVL